MTSITITKDIEVEIEVELDDLEDVELLAELHSRYIATGYSPADFKDLITLIYENRRAGKPYELLLDKLIFEVLGRVV